jgi:ABC-type transport system involved in multi-copper enzyme maturation permease subunit
MKNRMLELVIASVICLAGLVYLIRADVYSAKLVGMMVVLVLAVVTVSLALGKYARSKGKQSPVGRKRITLIFLGLGILMLVMAGIDFFVVGIGEPGWKGPFVGSLLFGLAALRARHTST